MPASKLKVVVTRKLPAPVELRMKELFDARLNEADIPLTTEQLAEAMQTADVLVPTVTDRIDGRLMARAGQQLRLIAQFGAGVDNIDVASAVQRGITVARDGEVTWPPPAVQVSAAPTQAVTEQVIAEVPVKEPMSAARRFTYVGIGAAILLFLVAASPPSFRVHLTVFVLAIVIGYYVIGSVHHALHTPLMSVTNAISGIIVVGALLQIGHGNTAITVLAFVAVLVASINVFGGFAVTRRMLSMFSRS